MHLQHGLWPAVVLTLATSLNAAEPPQPPGADGPTGRYQLVVSLSERMYLVDTVTGRCWSRSADGAWNDEGSPFAPVSTARELGPSVKDDRKPQLQLAEMSVTMTVGQRETVEMPGSDGTVRVRLGDITDEQVTVTILSPTYEPIMARTSLAVGESSQFRVDDTEYVIKLERLRNALIGHDFATFIVTRAAEAKADDEKPTDKKPADKKPGSSKPAEKAKRS